MTARIYALRPKLTQTQSHDYVSARHRVDDFDHKTWWKSVGLFWLAVIGGISLFGIGMGILKYLTQ